MAWLKKFLDEAREEVKKTLDLSKVETDKFRLTGKDVKKDGKKFRSSCMIILLVWKILQSEKMLEFQN